MADSPIIDLNRLAKDAHYHLSSIEPHYSIFLANAKRAGMKGVKDYVHLFYGGLEQAVQNNKTALDVHIDTLREAKSVTELDIRHIAQKIQASNLFSADLLTAQERFYAAVKKAGEPSEEEKVAYAIVKPLISKLLINQMLVGTTHPLLLATLKVFLLQYYSDYNSLHENEEIPKSVIKHVENIVAPDFDAAFKRMLEEKRAEDAQIKCALSDAELRKISKRVSKNHTENPLDFFRAIKDGLSTTWKKSPLILAHLILQMKEKGFISTSGNRGHFVAATNLFDLKDKSTKKIRLSELSNRVTKNKQSRFDKEREVVKSFLYGVKL